MEKNMRRNQKIHRNVGFFKRKYDEKKHDLEDKLGRKLTKKESEKLQNKVLKSYALRLVAGIGAAFMLGSAVYKLGEGSGRIEGVTQDENSNVIVDTSELENDTNLHVQGQSDREMFVNGLKIDIGSIEEQANENAMKEAEQQKREEMIQQIKNDIAGFQTKEDVLNYMKNLYKTEYNKENGQILNDFGIIFTQDGTIKTIDSETNSIIEQVSNGANVKSDNSWYRATENSEVLLDLYNPMQQLENLRKEYNRESGKEYLATYVDPEVVNSLVQYYDNQQEKANESQGMEIGD